MATWSGAAAYVTFTCRRSFARAIRDFLLFVVHIAGPLAFLRSGADRYSRRARHQPFSLWAAARNAAGNLGPVAHLQQAVRTASARQQDLETRPG